MGIIRNVKDWFNERGDDLFRVDKKVGELVSSRLLPQDVYDVFAVLEEENENAVEDNKKAGIELNEIAEKRRDRFEKLKETEEELKNFKEKHHGIFARVIYNLTPLRFFPTGREYQRLRREIKMLKREHKFWTRLYDESTHDFEATWEHRKETKRTLAEYKRIIVQKAKEHKNELKFLKEYKKLITMDPNLNALGEESDAFKNNLNEAFNFIKNNWFEMNREELQESLQFNVKTVTKAIVKLRKNKELSEYELDAIRDIGGVRENRRSGRQEREEEEEEEQEEEQNKTSNWKNKYKPYVNYDEYGLNREVIQEIANVCNVKTAEDFLLGLAVKLHEAAGENTEELRKKIKEKLDNNPNDPLLRKCANEGAQMLRDMLQGKEDSGQFKPVLDLYQQFMEKRQKDDQTHQQSQEEQK